MMTEDVFWTFYTCFKNSKLLYLTFEKFQELNWSLYGDCKVQSSIKSLAKSSGYIWGGPECTATRQSLAEPLTPESIPDGSAQTNTHLLACIHYFA